MAEQTVPRTLAGGLRTLPTQRGPRPRRPGPARLPAIAVASVLTVVMALVSVTTVVVSSQASARGQQRTLAAVTAAGTDVDLSATLEAAGRSAASSAAGEQARSQASAVVTAARQAEAGAPHAGDVPLAQVDAAVDLVQALLGAQANARQLAAARVGLAQSVGVVQQREAAWQAAQVQAAASQAAAEQTASQAAAKAARAARSASNAGQAVRAASAAAVPDVTVPAAATIPSGGHACTSVGSGAAVASATDLGDTINAYRVAHGLPALTVVTSDVLDRHATAMADLGGIWHSGADNLVGCVANASASSLVVAWSRSAPHNAELLRTDVSTVVAGDAVRDGWLFGAVALR